jgi:hypothetical protein
VSRTILENVSTQPAPTPNSGESTRSGRDAGSAAPLAKIGMAVFAVGLIAIFADMILFAAGSRDLPVWLNLTAMLAPVGLGLGLIGVVRENRQSSPALTARKVAAQK